MSDSVVRFRKSPVRKESGAPAIIPSSSTFNESWAKRREFRMDGADGGFAKAALEAMGGRSTPSPAEALQIETTRLLKAFREAEGRDPRPEGDPEFWRAYSQILELRTGGVEKSTPVRKVKASEKELADRLSKAMKSGPSWLRAVAERSK